MIEETSAQFSIVLSIVESVRQRHNNIASRLSERYGEGLRYLIGRRCPDYAVECYAAVIEACIAALEREEVANDEEIPRLLQAHYRSISSQYPCRVEQPEIGERQEQTVNALRKKLSVFSPAQLEALRRFYVGGESPSVICESVGLTLEQFSFIRQVVRRLTSISSVPRKPNSPTLIEHQPTSKASSA